MWKLLKFSGHLLRTLFWLALLLIGGVVVLLYILEHGLPESAVKRISRKLSGEEVIVDIDRITFTPGSGIHLHGVTAVPRKLADESFGSVEDVIIRISLSPLTDHRSRVRGVTLRGVEMPHHPRRIFRKLAKLEKEKKPREPRKKIPDMDPFKVLIENSCIIGMRTSRAEATVTLNDPLMTFSEATLVWQNETPPMQIAGAVQVNLDTDIIQGDVAGQTFPENIEPFLVEMGARTVIREMERFSDLQKPAEANCRFNANIENGDFMLDLDLNIEQCAYRDVPLDFARGNIRAWETNGTTQVKLTNLTTANKSGRAEGDIFYDENDESVKIRAASTMDHNDVLAMIHILTHGELKPLEPESPPVVSAVGVVAATTNSPVSHDLSGKVRIGNGVVFGLIVSEASADFRVKGDNAYLDNVLGKTPSGGNVSGQARFDIPDNSDLPPAITADVNFNRIDLTDLARVFSITNARGGECFGEMHLAGVLGTNQLHTINGNGSFSIKNSRIIRLKLFAGLTDYITRNIPGVSSVVDQSDCSLDFTIKDGVLSSDNFLIEGDVFSIQGKGTYDIANDRLKFTVHVALFRQKSIVGQISRIVTFPFKKLLLEFKVFGSVDNPEWSYVNILEKITDQIPEKSRE